jgi:hypothetical protein
VKLPDGSHVHKQWPNFRRIYGEHSRRIKFIDESVELIKGYIYDTKDVMLEKTYKLGDVLCVTHPLNGIIY